MRPITASLIAPARRLFDSQGDDQWTQGTTVYRCMSGAVWLCSHGANLTCAKADTRVSIPSVTAFCKQNPNGDVVPMVVTGHGVNHSWRCLDGKARVEATEAVDARGFIASQWKRLAP